MPITGPSPTIAKTSHKTKPKPVVDNSKSKSDENVSASDVTDERRALEERKVCREANELVNAYIKNLNKEFKRGRQLYVQETTRFRAREKGLWGCVERGIAKRFFDNETEHPDLQAFVKATKADYKKWKVTQPPEASEEQWEPYNFRTRRVDAVKTSGKRKAADTELASEEFVDEPEHYDDDVFNNGSNDPTPDSEDENDEDDEQSQCDDTATAHASAHDEDESDVVETTESYLAQPVRRDKPKGKRSRFDKAFKKSGGGGGGSFLSF